MALFNKKKNTTPDSPGALILPDLPPADDDMALPSIDDLGGLPTGLPPLEPNLPSLEPNNELPSIPPANEAIKHAITAPPRKSPIQSSPIPSPIPSPISKFQVVESPNQESPIKIGHEEPNFNLPEPPQPQLTRSIANRPYTAHPSKENEPVYVRLDKFQTTVGAFAEIRDKVFEIEKLLTKIKEVREKEDRELEEWDNEIQVIKSRIESVDKNIFDKLG